MWRVVTSAPQRHVRSFGLALIVVIDVNSSCTSFVLGRSRYSRAGPSSFVAHGHIRVEEGASICHRALPRRRLQEMLLAVTVMVEPARLGMVIHKAAQQALGLGETGIAP